jgi:amidase
MAFLSIGSDIGGSVRGPAAFCGVYGHKPTLDLVDLGGHLPGGVHGMPGFSTLLAVAGPMARTADDLEAALRVLAGPEAPEAKAFRWTLPEPRHQSLRDYRIGYVLSDPVAPVSAETRAVLERAVRACERAGARLVEGWPPEFRLQDLLDTYFFLLGAFIVSVSPSEERERARLTLATQSGRYGAGALSSFAEWQQENMKRLAYRAMWERVFQSIDVFLLPAMFTAAFPHDSTPTDRRAIPMPEGGTQPFRSFLAYIGPATLTGCPATVAPAGLSASGLPVGLQIVGPYLEDATPIQFAKLLAREIGGFQPPPGYV